MAKNKKDDTKYSTIIQELMQGQPAGGWVSWIFDIQNSLINYNHLTGFSEEGSSEFANNFFQLKNFFDELDKLKK